MPTFTVYTLGDVGSYWSMLNGIAMIFGLKGFWASAGLTGSLILLVMVCIHFITRAGGGQGGHSPVLGPLYLAGTFAFMSINSSVVVQDIYTGKIIKVDNIPIIISLPSSLMTTAGYKLFTTADTAFSTVDGNYMSVGTNGMESPLKLLLAMRKGFSTSSPNLALSIKVFAQNCTTGGDSNFDKSAYEKSKNGFEYLTAPGHFNSTALTFDFPVGKSEVKATNCADEAATLKMRVADYMALTSQEGNPNMVITGNMGTTIKPDGTPHTIVELTQSIQSNVIENLHSSAQSAQDVMANMLFYDVINAGMDCAGVAPTPEASNACWTENAIIRQGLEKWKADAAAAGTFFGKFMAQSIVFLQLMFFGFSPIILVTCLFMGEKSLGLFAKYLVFGGWTISWLPFACVIQMYTQNQVAAKIGAMSVLTIGGITPGNMSDYYDMVSGNVALASDLMGIVPMLSLGLLTGSGMAMAGMAGHFGRMSDASQAGAVSSPQLTQSNPYHTQDSRATSNSQTSLLSGAQQYLPTFDRTQSVSSGMQSASSLMTTASHNLSATAGNLRNAMHTDSTASAHEKSAATSLSDAISKQAVESKKFDESLAASKDLNVAQKAAIQAGVAAGVDWSVISAKVSALGTDEASKSAAQKFSSSHSDTYTSTAGANKQLAFATQDAIKSMNSRTDATSTSTSRAASQALGNMRSASEAFTHTAASTNQSAISNKVDAGAFAAGVANDSTKSYLADSMLMDMKNSAPSDFEKIAVRSQYFHDKGIPTNQAQYAALGEHLAAREMAGGAGGIEAGAKFDSLNTSVLSGVTDSATSNSGIVNAGTLNSSVAGITAPSVSPSVAGAGGYSSAQVRKNEGGVTINNTGLSGGQRNVEKAAEIERAGMRSANNSGKIANLKTFEAPTTIATGASAIEESRASKEVARTLVDDVTSAGKATGDAIKGAMPTLAMPKKWEDDGGLTPYQK